MPTEFQAFSEVLVNIKLNKEVFVLNLQSNKKFKSESIVTIEACGETLFIETK